MYYYRIEVFTDLSPTDGKLPVMESINECLKEVDMPNPLRIRQHVITGTLESETKFDDRQMKVLADPIRKQVSLWHWAETAEFFVEVILTDAMVGLRGSPIPKYPDEMSEI